MKNRYKQQTSYDLYMCIYIYIYANYVRYPVTKTFTTLRPTVLHSTCRHHSSHLNFTQLHFTNLSFGLTPFRFPTVPFDLTSLHFTSLHFTFRRFSPHWQYTVSCIYRPPDGEQLFVRKMSRII